VKERKKKTRPCMHDRCRTKLKANRCLYYSLFKWKKKEARACTLLASSWIARQLIRGTRSIFRSLVRGVATRRAICFKTRREEENTKRRTWCSNEKRGQRSIERGEPKDQVSWRARTGKKMRTN
jgi:hypothetical protein